MMSKDITPNPDLNSALMDLRLVVTTDGQSTVAGLYVHDSVTNAMLGESQGMAWRHPEDAHNRRQGFGWAISRALRSLADQYETNARQIFPGDPMSEAQEMEALRQQEEARQACEVHKDQPLTDTVPGVLPGFNPGRMMTMAEFLTMVQRAEEGDGH